MKSALKAIGIEEDQWPARLLHRPDLLAKKIAEDPLNPSLHLENALRVAATGNHFLAYSEFKTALYLGLAEEQSGKHLDDFAAALPELPSMNHNVYFRLKSLANEIIRRSNSTTCSVLDVGGGSGALAAFIPEYSYCLAEPTANGISGTDLPFADRSFDLVVSCHVLEHIPPDDRELFLDQLLSKASSGVILLNPFEVPKTLVTERLQLVIDVTQAAWAREHLDCRLPKIEDIESYAAARGLRVATRPNGTLTTSLAFVFIEYFAGLAGAADEKSKVDAFFNKHYEDILDSDTYPNAGLVFIGR